MGRPRLFTDDELRAKRRVKSAAWREANRERAREINREAMKRAAAVKAIEAGREPGKTGRPSSVTAEEKRVRRLERATKGYYDNLERSRKLAADGARRRRAEKKAGTYVPQKPKLTAEERRLTEVSWSAIRRTRMRANGGKHTKNDLVNLMAAQNRCCKCCGVSFDDAKPHLDHIIPVVHGGTSDVENLQFLCEPCNLAKGARYPMGINAMNAGA